MAFTRLSGKHNILNVKTTTTIAYTNAELVYRDPNNTGVAIPADATAGEFIGITMEAITAASTKGITAGSTIMVDVPDSNDIFEADVTGTLTTLIVNSYVDLANSTTVDATASSKSIVYCVGFISATKGLFKITAGISNRYIAAT